MELNDRFKYQGTFYASGMSRTRKKDWKRCDNSRIPDCLELIYCISGEDEVRVNGKIYSITPGTVRIFPPTTQIEEDVWIRSLKYGEFVNVGFITKNPFVTETVVVYAADNRKIHDLFMQLLKIHKKHTENLDAYFFEGSSVLFLLLQELQQLIDIDNSALKEIEKKLEPAIKYIYEHCCDEYISLVELPKMCGMKKDRFYSMFQERYHITPSAYATNLRMQHATDLLLEGNLTIAEIAKKTGYETGAYFSRVFKKHFGIIPSKYKKY